MLTGLLFGTLPAMTSLRSKQADAVKAGSRTVGDGRSRRRLQRVLIVAQVAIAFVLLVGAGQLLVSFYRLQRTDAGYKADRVLTAEVFGNFSKYRTVDDLLRLYQPLIERLESRPGVLSAAVTNGVPLSGIDPAESPFRIEGRADRQSGEPAERGRENREPALLRHARHPAAARTHVHSE